ncbi:secretin receptor [Trichinella spiralis]|uniref:secretin receptor n=1 Tax=Trichinella spiralis TaxID=6334 RepID=UPI0001EFC432|nr:secretin receptor [Trichinella spiralis]
MHSLQKKFVITMTVLSKIVALNKLACLSSLKLTFYGSCEFRDIPEGYEPHFWEYEKHPISQFFMRYFTVNPQKMYEKRLAKISIEMQKRRWILEEKRVKHLMFERADYKAWYYIPMKAKWTERNRWHFDRYRDNIEYFQHLYYEKAVVSYSFYTACKSIIYVLCKQ